MGLPDADVKIATDDVTPVVKDYMYSVWSQPDKFRTHQNNNPHWYGSTQHKVGRHYALPTCNYSMEISAPSGDRRFSETLQIWMLQMDSTWQMYYSTSMGCVHS